LRENVEAEAETLLADSEGEHTLDMSILAERAGRVDKEFP